MVLTAGLGTTRTTHVQAGLVIKALVAPWGSFPGSQTADFNAQLTCAIGECSLVNRIANCLELKIASTD